MKWEKSKASKVVDLLKEVKEGDAKYFEKEDKSYYSIKSILQMLNKILKEDGKWDWESRGGNNEARKILL